MKTKLFLIVAAMAMMAGMGFGQIVTFAWDPHPESIQISGFRLYQSRVAGSYSAAPVATYTGGALTTGTIPKPTLGKYFYVLTAFTADTESDYSNEVSLVVKPQKPNLKTPILSAIIHLPKAGIDKLAGVLNGKQNLKIVPDKE
jgi:hypothetical protein